MFTVKPITKEYPIDIYLRDEITRFVQFQQNQPLLASIYYREPELPTEGMIVVADGTDWNPGSGGGFYGYYGATWVKLHA